MKQTTTPDEPVVELPERIWIDRYGYYKTPAETSPPNNGQVYIRGADLATGREAWDAAIAIVRSEIDHPECANEGAAACHKDCGLFDVIEEMERARDRSTSDNSQDQDSVEMQNEQAEREMRQTAPCRSSVDFPKDKEDRLRRMYAAAKRAGVGNAEGRTFEEWFDRVSDYGLDDAEQALIAEEERRCPCCVARGCICQTTESLTQATSGSEPSPSPDERVLQPETKPADSFRETPEERLAQLEYTRTERDAASIRVREVMRELADFRETVVKRLEKEATKYERLAVEARDYERESSFGAVSQVLTALADEFASLQPKQESGKWVIDNEIKI